MNKFLLLTLTVMTLGFAAPAMADDHAMGAEEASTETVIEQVVDENGVVHCLDEHGEEVECPVVEEGAEEAASDAVEAEATVEAPATETAY